MTSSFVPIHLGAPGEEISKKDLNSVVQRFKHLNFNRLQRVQAFFQTKQQDFLHLLPLLFHINHPLLPGFVSLETPAGIPDYQPSKQAMDAAAQFSRGFVYKRKALKTYPINSIFLMGSVGSMAFLKNSDIDIWLCYQPCLSHDALQELRRKTREVEKWAATLKIEVHFFLVDHEQFRRGENTPISAESSGQTQHYLLLEEFYRTSIYIAGRFPVWWLVPPEQEKHYKSYVAHLIENRFIAEMDVLDFGGLEDMPLGEFVSATLWHIYKSLSSPHKSLLKLLLMESYASEFPQPNWLCMLLKQAIYQGDFNVDSLDPYFLIYSKVDTYLQKDGSPHRLNLARECFTLKIMGVDDTALDTKIRQLRESYMQKVAGQWCWPPGLLQNLGQQKFWTIQKACVEHGVIRDQLQNCQRMMMKFAGNPSARDIRDNQDIVLISRKLRAALDLGPGKLEVLTTRNMVHVSPDVLSFVEHEVEGLPPVWRLYTENMTVKSLKTEPYLKQFNSFPELLSWAVLNGLYKKTSNLKLLSHSLQLSGSELAQLANELNEFLSRYLTSKDEGLEVYESPDCFLATLLVINFGENLAMDTHSQQFVMSERSDPFSYGEQRLNFVQTVLAVSISRWGEVTLKSYRGFEGFLTCMTEVFNHTARPLNSNMLQVACLTKVRGRSIALRIKLMFENLVTCFAEETVYRPRYVLAGEGAYYIFRCTGTGAHLSYFMLENHQQLLQELGSAQPQFSPVLFDVLVLEQTYIPALYQQNQPGLVQVFFHASAKHVAVYIIDEKGALYVAHHAKSTPEQVLHHYAWFLNTLLTAGKLPATSAIKYAEIQKNSMGVVSFHSVDLKPEELKQDLRVAFCFEESAGLVIYCNSARFPIADPESYAKVKKQILSYRQSKDDYALYLNDINVPCRMLGIDSPNQAQTVHYLRYKQKVEDKLNWLALSEQRAGRQ